MNPCDLPIKEDDKAKSLYLKSHRQYEPGQQKERDYNMPFNKHSHTYGKPIGLIQNAAKLVIQPENDLDSFAKTTIVKKNQIDQKNLKEDPIGRCKNLGQTNHYHKEGTPYGVVEQHDEWNAGRCI